MCQNETQEGWQCSVLATPQTLGHAVEAEQRLAIFGDEKKIPDEKWSGGSSLNLFTGHLTFARHMRESECQ